MNKKDVCATQIAYVRFTEDDLADLDNQVRRVGASSRGAYIRSLIKGVRPVELPPADYVALIDELAKLRRSIDTMAARAADNKASALSPVEYYTLSSLTALTLQKIRLAALPQQYHLPEDMSQSKAQIASEDYNPGRLDMEAIEAALCEAVEMHDGLVSEDFIDLFVSQVTPLSDSRFAWCLDFSPQPTVAFLNLAGQRKYTTCSMDSKLHFGPFADEEGHTIPFPGSLRR